MDLATSDAGALHEVARALAAAEGCMTLLSQSAGELMTLALDHVLKAEMARAAGLLQLLRLVKGDLVPVTRPVSSDAVVQRAIQSAEPEARLRGIALAAAPDAREVGFVADEELLADLLFGVLLTTFALMDGVQRPQVDLVVTVSETAEVALSVTQAQVVAPSGWANRPVGAARTDTAGGVLGALAMNAGQRLARAWGGRFAVVAAGRSTSVSIHLPVIQPRASGSRVLTPAASNGSDPRFS